MASLKESLRLHTEAPYEEKLDAALILMRLALTDGSRNFLPEVRESLVVVANRYDAAQLGEQIAHISDIGLTVLKHMSITRYPDEAVLIDDLNKELEPLWPDVI
jgi:hypothetical protein